MKRASWLKRFSTMIERRVSNVELAEMLTIQTKKADLASRAKHRGSDNRASLHLLDFPYLE